MSLIDFPIVPLALGVPLLRRASGAAIPGIALGVGKSLLLKALFDGGQWGVFDQSGKALGNPAKITGVLGSALDSFGIGAKLSTHEVAIKSSATISTHPVQRGGFAAYNKVQNPIDPQVTMCMQGDEGNRKTFLEALEKARVSTDLYSVVTPSATFTNCSIIGVDYTRSASKGATLLTVQLTLREVRVVSAQLTKSKIIEPKDLAARADVNAGKVTTSPAEKSTLVKLLDKLK